MQILTDYVAKKTKTWKHDRMVTVGASEIGACERRTYYLKSSERADKDHLARWGATHRGDLIEQYLVVPALRQRFGKKLLWSGKAQKTLIDKFLSATPDGLIVNAPRNMLRHLGIKDIESDCLLTEIKSIDPRANLEKEKHQHRLQAITQLGLVRTKTKYRPMYVLIMYVDASFHDEIKEFVVRYDPDVFLTLQKRAQKILSAAGAQELKPEGWIAGGQECETCPWKDACGIERHALPSEKFKGEPIDPQRTAEITDMVREYRDKQHSRDALDAQAKELSEAIKSRLRDWQIRKVPGVVTMSQVKGRESYDLSALKAAAEEKGIDTEPFKRIGDAYSRLTVSLPEE